MSGTNVMLYRSTDTGAPTLSGTAGALIAVLDGCLVNGYNSKTVTIARTGQIATATCATAHGYAADGLTKINISGASQTEYNGDFQISNVTTNTFDFTVTGTPATPATGTITAKVAPIGWGKPFSGTNKATYRSAEVTGTRMFLRVDDNNPGADTNKSARATGYEAMTDVDTGTGLFPTVAQSATNIIIYKADGAVSRDWILIGDGYEFFIFPRPWVVGSYLNSYQHFHFGDIASEMASDPYGCLIYGANQASNNGISSVAETLLATLGAQTGHYMARAYTQTGSAGACGKVANTSLCAAAMGIGNTAYPAPHNNGLYVTPIYIWDGSIRGQLKGLWPPCHSRPFGTTGTVLAANLSPIGHRLFSITVPYNQAAQAGEILIDIDGPWR